MAEDALEADGRKGLLKFWFRELRDLPRNLLREHYSHLQKLASTVKFFNPFSSAAFRGALGFGIGIFLLIILRWISDPDNNLLFKNLSLGLLRETLLFSMISVIGWSCLGQSIFSVRNNKMLLATSLFLGGLGGLLATHFVYSSFSAMTYQTRTTTQLGTLIQFEGALIYGAFIGAVFGLLEGHHHRLLHLSIFSALSFGIAHLLAEWVFHLLYLLPYADYWKSGPWFIPLALASSVQGIVGGALLGWIVERERPARPTRLSVLVIAAKNQSAI